MALSFRENIRVGFSDFWSRKIRSFVTIFGIILGTMSIIVVLSLVNGMNKKTLEWMIQRGGFTKIVVRKNWRYTPKKILPRYLTLEEIEYIKNKIKGIKYFSPQKSNYLKFHYADKEDYFSLFGVLPDFKYIEEWKVQKGRFISQYDVQNKNSVVVIGTQVKETLFGTSEAIGKYITIGGKKLKIVGIMEHRFMKSDNSLGNKNALSYLNRRAFIPLTTYISKIGAENKFTSFTLKVENLDIASKVTKDLNELLLDIRQGEPIFWVRSMEERRQDMEKNSMMFKIIFYVISLISLLVGGIVIMNILLSTVKERTREIGVRIAIGAKQVDIFMQFLIQAVLITFIGGLFGVIFGLLSLKKIAAFMNFDLIPSLQTILVALTVSVGIGLIFGILPSIKASKLNPVEALRYE